MEAPAPEEPLGLGLRKLAARVPIAVAPAAMLASAMTFGFLAAAAVVFGWSALVYALLAPSVMYRVAFSEAILPVKQSYFVPGIITSTTMQAALPLAGADTCESRPAPET